jgi:hypothetical protein
VGLSNEKIHSLCQRLVIPLHSYMQGLNAILFNMQVYMVHILLHVVGSIVFNSSSLQYRQIRCLNQGSGWGACNSIVIVIINARQGLGELSASL